MSFLQRISHRSRLISADPSCLNRPRIRRRLFPLITLIFCFCFINCAYAIVPALVWIGEQAAIIGTQSLVVNAVTRGFAANDPYVPARVTIPTTNFAKAFRAKGGIGINPYWAGLAIAAEIYLESGEFKKNQPTSEYLWKINHYSAVEPNLIIGSPDPTAMTAILPTTHFTEIVSIDAPTNMNALHCKFSEKYPDVLCAGGFYVMAKYKYQCPACSAPEYPTGSYSFFRSIDPVPMGVKKTTITDAAINTMALQQLLADNRPAAAFSDTAGNPIPEFFQDAKIETLPNVDSATLSDLEAYRQGLLQSTDPNAAHYVSPERYAYIKDLAAKQDYANTPEGELDALNEKMKQPITQAQYEESNAKADAATQRALVPVTGLEQLISPFEQYQSDVAQTPNQSINSMPLFGFPRFGGGSCSVISLNFSIMGYSFKSDTSSLCGFYYEYLLPAFTALFYILTGYVIWLDVREAISRRV